MFCRIKLPGKDAHVNNMEKIKSLWNGNPVKMMGKTWKFNNIVKMHGHTEVNKDSLHFLKWSIEKDWIKKGFHEDFMLSEGEVNRIVLEMDAYNKRIQGNYANGLEKSLYVGEALSKRSPISLKHEYSLDAAVNYERNAMNQNKKLSELSADELGKAYWDSKDAILRFGNPLIKEINKLQKKAAQTGTSSDKARYLKAIEEFMISDEGKVLDQYIKLAQMPSKDFSYIVKKNNSLEQPYNNHVIRAVEFQRNHSKEMGKVLVDGLKNLKHLAVVNHLGLTSADKLSDSRVKSSPELRSILRKVDEAIARVEKGMEEGGYFPHFLLENLVDMKNANENFLASKVRNNTKQNMDALVYSLDNVYSITRDIEAGIPDHAKPRAEELIRSYNKNPLEVMKQYGYNVISFNKQTRMARVFLESMKQIDKAEISPEFVRAMKNHLLEVYTISSQGHKDRPDWVNNAIFTLSAAQTAKTMALALPTAALNAGQIINYYAAIGMKAKRNADVAQKHDPELQRMLREDSKETGFEFMDSDIAQELYAEGLLPSKGVDPKTVRFNSNNGKIEFEQNGVMRNLAPLAEWGMQKLLIFQRITENWSRRKTWNTAYTLKYLEQKSQPAYWESVGESKARANQKDAANQAVKTFLYEYAPHSKAPTQRGYASIKGPNGEVINKSQVYTTAVTTPLMALMHFPASLLNMQVKIAKGAKKAFKAGQWDSQELEYAVRYAGVFAGIKLASVVMNADFTKILGNNTIETAENMVGTIGYALEDELKMTPMSELFKPPKGKERVRGLVSTVTGPLPDTARYLLDTTLFASMDHDTMSKILWGNVDYSEQTGNEAEKAKWYQLATEYGRIRAKYLPAIRDGRGWDIFRHMLSAYPSTETKKLHKQYVSPTLTSLIGKRRKKKRKGKAKRQEQMTILTALDNLSRSNFNRS